MLRKICSVFMALLVALFCLPVSSLAAESDLQKDFDDGLMTLTTGLTYYRTGSGYTNLRYFHTNMNGISDYSDYNYDFSRFAETNPNHRFGHIFELSYNDGRVLMPKGDSLTFSIHNFYSGFYWGEYDEENFEEYRYCWLDISKYTGFFMYFWDFEGNRYTVSKDMYTISFNQDEAMITIQMKSDMYDLDVYKIRLFINFDVSALWTPYYGAGGWCTEDWFNDYDSFYCNFGYETLYFEISSEDAATTGLLTSIIDYIKEMWNSIKELPANIKTALTSLFEGLSSSISGFFDGLKNKLTDLFSVFTEEQPTYAPIDEGDVPSDYQNAEDDAMDAAGVGDLDANIDSAFENADSVFNNNNAYAFISASMEQIVFGNIKISGLVIFSLAMGLCVLVLGRKLNSA